MQILAAARIGSVYTQVRPPTIRTVTAIPDDCVGLVCVSGNAKSTLTDRAIAELNGAELDGRAVNVNEA
jgi:hypothetical protein